MGSCDGNQVSTNPRRSPSATVNSATVVMSSPCVSTGDQRQSASGPATATSASSTRRTHGTMRPWSNRITNSNRIGTDPDRPSTIRTMSGACPRGGMKSITRTVPWSVSCTVSSTSVS